MANKKLEQEFFFQWHTNNKVPIKVNWITIDNKKNNENFTFEYGLHKTIFGQTFITLINDEICTLFFTDISLEANINELNKKFKKVFFLKNQVKTKICLDNLFKNLKNTIQLRVYGTAFQIQVWQSLLKIPYGKKATYQDIALAIKNPLANRALGTAIGANPIAYVIPCHRVVRKDGKIGAYRWGIDRKMKMLKIEQEQSLVHL